MLPEDCRLSISPIPNHQSPIPNPQSQIPILLIEMKFLLIYNIYINKIKNLMYGNLSKTIVSVPNSFHLSAHITSSTLNEFKYKEPAIYDTFSYLKKINSNPNNRYFRVSEHFKENSPYKDLNFNNNKRYISPLTDLKHTISLNYLLFGRNNDINKKKFRKSISQEQLLSRTNSMNLSKVTYKENSKENNETHSSQIINFMNNSIKENNNDKQQMDLIEEKNELSKINEVLPIEENTKEIDNNSINDDKKPKNSEEEEKIRKENYIKKLLENRPKNYKEINNFLDIKFTDETKQKQILPKIGRVPNSISQDDLFKKTMTLKLASLSMIRPEVKEGLFKRKKNMILKRDYDLIRRIYNVRKKLPFHLKNIISYEALMQK